MTDTLVDRQDEDNDDAGRVALIATNKKWKALGEARNLYSPFPYMNDAS